MFGRFDNHGYQALGEIFINWQEAYKINWDTKSLEILRFYVQQDKASTYQCFKYLNEVAKIKISYKNVHKKIGKLLSFRLITLNKQSSDLRDKNEYNDITAPKHGAIYYKVSDFGLFYAISNRIVMNDFWGFHSSMVLKHKEYVVYKNMLYPHIPLAVLKEIKSSFMWRLILGYIEECCVVVQNAFQYIIKQDCILDPVKKTGGLLFCHPFSSNLMLEEFKMQKSFVTLDSLDKEFKEPYTLDEEIILDENNNNVLKISSSENLYNPIYFKIIEVSPSKNRVKKLQIYKNTYRDPTNLIFEFEIEDKEKSDLQNFKGSYVPMTWNKLLKWYLEGDEYLLGLTNKIMELIINMLSIKYDIFLSSTSKDETLVNNVLNDLYLLRNDKDFLRTFHIIKRHVQDNFKNFEEMGKPSS